MKLLIIEDDNLWQCKLQMFTEEVGLELIGFASNIAESENLLAAQKPDIIIADVMLDNECVFDLYKNPIIKKIPTVFITASDKEKYYKKVQQLEFATLLVKPFHKHSLLSSIDLVAKAKKIATTVLLEEDTTEYQTKMLLKIIGDEALMDLFNIGELEKKIIVKRLSDFKPFSVIGKEINLSSERARFLYTRAIKKWKAKVINASTKYKEYIDFIRQRDNKKAMFTMQQKLLSGTQEVEPEKMNLDELDEIPTKFKNILKDKGIDTLGKLTEYSFRELVMVRKMGDYAVLQIEKSLHKYGLKLKQ